MGYIKITNALPSAVSTPAGYEDEDVQMSVDTTGVDGGRSPREGVESPLVSSTEPATTPEVERVGLEQSQEAVYLCKRPADLPVNRSLPHDARLEHHWLKTDRIERGMGPADGRVPGERGNSDLPLSRTTVNDHAGKSRESGVECVELPSIDPSCVEKELELGRETGRWWVDNHCQTFAARVIETCHRGDPGDEPEPVDGARGY